MMQAATPARGRSAAELIETFEKSEGLNDRIGVLRQIAIVGKEESVPLLTKLLDHEDPVIRQYALAAAEANPAPAAGAALVAALGRAQDSDWKVAVINALGGRREPTAVELLGGLITDPDERVAAAAIAALGNIGTRQAAMTLWNARPKWGVVPSLTADFLHAMMSSIDQIEASKEPRVGLYRGLPPSVPLAAVANQSHLRLAGIRGLVKTGDTRKGLGYASRELKQGTVREQAEAARILVDVEDEDRILANLPGHRFINVQKELLALLPTLPPTAQAFLLEALAEREARIAARRSKE